MHGAIAAEHSHYALMSMRQRREMKSYSQDKNATRERDLAAYVREVNRRFAGRVFAPDDLDRYCIDTDIRRPCPNR